MSLNDYPLREGLPPLPRHMQHLPRDARGYPVPAFVEWIDGKPEFRVMSAVHLARCVKLKLCWLCGAPLGKHMTFTIGPMCAINRISAEPPSHTDCAQFAAKACPFLTLPKAQRRASGLDQYGPLAKPAGEMLTRNPGVTLLWTCHGYKVLRVDHGVLFELGHHIDVEWFAEGRHATRAEIEESINSGLPLLAERAKEEGGRAPLVLESMYRDALRLLPA